MICKNCGAEYPDSNLSCPYCHTENRKVALRKKKEILKGYDREADAMRAQAELYPEKTANKWTKKIFVGLGIVGALGVLITIIVMVISNISVNREYEKEREHSQKLEEFMAVSDYKGMTEYMNEKKLGSGYQKYDQVARMYRNYLSIKESDELIRTTNSSLYKNREDWESINSFSIDQILDCSADVIRYYEEYGKDKEFLGNEDAMEEIYLKVAAELEKYGFTEEDFGEIALENDSARCEEFHLTLSEYYWQNAK